jgi:hypothetical protein
VNEQKISEKNNVREERKEKMQDPIADLITAYHEFNAAVIDELHEEPSALEFMRYVAKNRPFVVRGGAKEWKACESWDAAYLSDVMRSEDVQVAVTPYGYVALKKESPSYGVSCLVLFLFSYVAISLFVDNDLVMQTELSSWTTARCCSSNHTRPKRISSTSCNTYSKTVQRPFPRRLRSGM